MDLVSTRCCAVQEIVSLASAGGAKQALEKICKDAFQSRVRYHAIAGQLNKLYTFYWFSQPVYKHSPYKYGFDFAELLRKEGLGEVLETKPSKNAAFHPDHSNVMWIWAPDQQAVAKWWKENQPAAKPEVKKAVPASPPVPAADVVIQF